jgi:hypothetical protein
MSINHMSDKQIRQAKKWGDHRKNIDLPDPEDIFAKERCEMIAFKHQLSEDFPIEFGKQDWKIIDFEDRHKYKSQYYFQINVDKPSNVNEDGTTKDETYEYIKSTGRPYLVCELSAFRQNSYKGNPDDWYYTLGWFHFLRQGYFNNIDCPGDRWNTIKKAQDIQVCDWRTGKGGYALICLQKVNDSTLIPMHETHGKYRHWLMLVINQIRNIYPGLPIVIRPHLRTKYSSYKEILGYIEGVTLSKTWEDRTFFEGGKGLQEDLSGARFVVSYNSNVLTQAVLQGIPSFCYDIRSMASPVCLTPDQLANPKHAQFINREPWLHNLAYTQWTRKEIRDGQAWNHLKKIGF